LATALRRFNSRAIEARRRWQNRKTDLRSRHIFTGDAGFAGCEPICFVARNWK
jgi:hypothetical protein